MVHHHSSIVSAVGAAEKMYNKKGGHKPNKVHRKVLLHSCIELESFPLLEQFVGDTATEVHIRIKYKAEELHDFGENKNFLPSFRVNTLVCEKQLLRTLALEE